MYLYRQQNRFTWIHHHHHYHLVVTCIYIIILISLYSIYVSINTGLNTEGGKALKNISLISLYVHNTNDLCAYTHTYTCMLFSCV